MKKNVTYKEAVKILAAFLGSNIEVIHPGPANFGKCQVYRLHRCEFWTFERDLIADGDDWEMVFEKIFPSELYQQPKKPDYRGLHFASKIYQYRYIGKNL